MAVALPRCSGGVWRAVVVIRGVMKVPTVAEGTGKRLRQPPPTEVAQSERQTDAACALAGGRGRGREKKAHGLASAHGERKGACCAQQDDPPSARGRTGLNPGAVIIRYRGLLLLDCEKPQAPGRAI